MPKLRRFRPKQHGGVKVSLFNPATGTYVATDVDLRIIDAIFQYCIDMYLISASSASGIVFGATLPHAPLPAPILLRANQINPDGTFRSQDQVANRERFAEEGMIIPECCLKLSFVETGLSGRANVTVGGHVKRTCKKADLEQEALVQSEIFRSTLCGTSAPLTFTPDKIAATTMPAASFLAIVNALIARIPSPPLPHVARALDMLREIRDQAISRGLHIHIFVMELLKGETLRKILAKNIVSVSDQDKTNACNDVAISVIMTFLKSLYWSRDQHADNAMISGANTFTLDFGLMYHLLLDEDFIKSLLDRLLSSRSININDVLKYFGVVIGMPKAAADAEVRRVFNELYDMLRNPNLKQLMLINPAADMAAEIDRISGIVFQMLSFFLLVDGLSNRYRHSTHHFQSTEYMERVFDSRPALSGVGFEGFLHHCSINLSGFGGVPGSGPTVRQNMAYIVQGLQPALALCPISGPPRTMNEIPLSAAFPGSPGQVSHDAAIEAARRQAAIEEEAARRQAAIEEEAARQAAIEEEAARQAAIEAEARRLLELKAERNAAAVARKNVSGAKQSHYAKSPRSRSRSPKATAAAAPSGIPPGRVARLIALFSGRGDTTKQPNPDDLDGGTVKRRFRVQKRQKQTMRPCNIRRRQRRTHAIRRRRNKNKTR